MTTEQELNLALLIGRVDAKVDILLDRTTGQDKRITAVEHKLWWGSGAVAFAAAFMVPKLRALVGV